MFKTFLFFIPALLITFLCFSQRITITTATMDAQVLFGVKKIKEAASNKKWKIEETSIVGTTHKCKGTEGLISEGEKMMGEDMDPKVMDAAIIASAQKIEHYEISGYGTARAYARELGLNEVAGLLETTLNEEYRSDDMLTSLALNKVNLEAETAAGPLKKNRGNNQNNGSKKAGGSGGRNGVNSGKQGGQKVQRAAPKKAAAKGGKKAAAKKGTKKAAPKKKAARNRSR